MSLLLKARVSSTPLGGPFRLTTSLISWLFDLILDEKEDFATVPPPRALKLADGILIYVHRSGARTVFSAKAGVSICS